MTDSHFPKDLRKKATRARAAIRAMIDAAREYPGPDTTSDGEFARHAAEAKAEYREGLRNGSLPRLQPGSMRDANTENMEHSSEKPKRKR